MTALTRWTASPSLLRPFSSSLRNLFDEPWGDQEVSDSWWPAVDVRETGDALFLHVELPGLSKKDIQVSLEGALLTITGERTLENPDNKATFHRLERRYGKFSRSFRLPGRFDGGKVKARFENGLLTLELPKTEQAKARQIEIN